jgi:hypothetical protein
MNVLSAIRVDDQLIIFVYDLCGLPTAMGFDDVIAVARQDHPRLAPPLPARNGPSSFLLI